MTTVLLENSFVCYKCGFKCQSSSRMAHHDKTHADGNKWAEQVKIRSVYVKGFPKDGTTLDTVTRFFKGFQGVDNIEVKFF